MAKSDLYVGLFAWRYGYIPDANNPKGLSVTELEYREAERRTIPRLIFMLDEAAAWPPKMLDSYTGESAAGQRIQQFRTELAKNRLASFFTSPEDLAAKLGAAVHLSNAVADASDASFDLAAIVGADAIDQPEMLFSQSYVPYLIERIGALGEAPLLTIDLKNGTYWWSTRLYALATLVLDYTAVEWFLFVNNGNDYVGMVRPRDLRRALAVKQSELDDDYRQAVASGPFLAPDWRQREGQVLEALVSLFRARPGGEEGLRFLVDSSWLQHEVPGMLTERIDRSGPFDPLATFQLLEASTPYVPITKGAQLIKVINRVGVATEIARTVVQRQLGR